MLVLTRKPGESIRIGEDVLITVFQTEAQNRGRVKIGIEAPKSITILREELYQLTKPEKKEG